MLAGAKFDVITKQLTIVSPITRIFSLFVVCFFFVHWCGSLCLHTFHTTHFSRCLLKSFIENDGARKTVRILHILLSYTLHYLYSVATYYAIICVSVEFFFISSIVDPYCWVLLARRLLVITSYTAVESMKCVGKTNSIIQNHVGFYVPRTESILNENRKRNAVFIDFVCFFLIKIVYNINILTYRCRHFFPPKCHDN